MPAAVVYNETVIRQRCSKTIFRSQKGVEIWQVGNTTNSTKTDVFQDFKVQFWVEIDGDNISQFWTGMRFINLRTVALILKLFSYGLNQIWGEARGQCRTEHIRNSRKGTLLAAFLQTPTKDPV